MTKLALIKPSSKPNLDFNDTLVKCIALPAANDINARAVIVACQHYHVTEFYLGYKIDISEAKQLFAAFCERMEATGSMWRCDLYKEPDLKGWLKMPRFTGASTST